MILWAVNIHLQYQYDRYPSNDTHLPVRHLLVLHLLVPHLLVPHLLVFQLVAVVPLLLFLLLFSGRSKH